MLPSVVGILCPLFFSPPPILSSSSSPLLSQTHSLSSPFLFSSSFPPLLPQKKLNRYDHVIASPRPDKWNLRAVFFIASVLAADAETRVAASRLAPGLGL